VAADACQALHSIPGHEDSGPGPVGPEATKRNSDTYSSQWLSRRRDRSGEIVMTIDFTLTPQQRVLQEAARDFAENVLRPVVRAADEEPDPLRAFNLTKPAYQEAVKRGIAFSMLPKQYGGGGLSNVDFVIAAEEICAVDPGFATTILVNGLGLMPVWYYGTEEQKQRFISRATSDTSGEFIVGYAASEPPGSPGGTANFDAPAINGAGMSVTATLDGDEYVVNGRKYWPCNVGGWDNQGGFNRSSQHRLLGGIVGARRVLRLESSNRGSSAVGC
jgi:hypothetical protein